MARRYTGRIVRWLNAFRHALSLEEQLEKELQSGREYAATLELRELLIERTNLKVVRISSELCPKRHCICSHVKELWADSHYHIFPLLCQRFGCRWTEVEGETFTIERIPVNALAYNHARHQNGIIPATQCWNDTLISWSLGYWKGDEFVSIDGPIPYRYIFHLETHIYTYKPTKASGINRPLVGLWLSDQSVKKYFCTDVWSVKDETYNGMRLIPTHRAASSNAGTGHEELFCTRDIKGIVLCKHPDRCPKEVRETVLRLARKYNKRVFWIRHLDTTFDHEVEMTIQANWIEYKW